MSEYLLKTDSSVMENYTGEIELKDLQEAVGGLIEIIHMNINNIMIVNEEGLIHNLPLNYLASNIVGSPIVGNAVVLTGDSVEKLT